ncbi:dipeptide epimerase [Lentilactobacillus sp. SPB1-3]|uniref:Dipeptide epimerase n=1 Tax=Lentilactobacillus terminaliae TaxID=3003483 RepID=A0ACD5DHM2_9LACO|nr:dipeptide epimerase [Lentilactobacillus sp. SPB1-3]MCZ0977030.1 dipeptide epimerase [Lentilactobacillus sp. SPB1-3]
MSTVIKSIKTQVVDVPLKQPFVTALRTVTTAETVIVEVQDSDGKIGYGEAAPTAVITGDTTKSIVSAIEDFISPKIIGMPLDKPDLIKETIDDVLEHNSSPKAAVNIAVNDLIAQGYGVPLYVLLGGTSNEVVTDYTVSVGSTDDMINQSQQYVAAGFDTLKIKVGADDELTDLKKVTAIRKAVGSDVKIRLDANQGWHAKQAVVAINRMEDAGLNIELVEQPVKSSDFEGMKYVTEHVDTMIMADESIFSVEDALRLISMRGCDLINLKLMKAGGIDNALKINTLAEAAGINCMVGSMIESSVSVSAAAHLAAAKRNIKYVDLDAALMFSKNPVSGGYVSDQNRIELLNKPGLGF